MENKTPLKQGMLKRSLKRCTPPSRTLSEQLCTDLLVRLQMPFLKPRCCSGELPPSPPAPRQEQWHCSWGLTHEAQEKYPLQAVRGPPPPQGSMQQSTALSAPALLGRESFLASSSRGASGFARSWLWGSAVIKSRRLLQGVTGEANTPCQSLEGGRGNCISDLLAAPHCSAAVLASPKVSGGLLMPQETTALPSGV